LHTNRQAKLSKKRTGQIQCESMVPIYAPRNNDINLSSVFSTVCVKHTHYPLHGTRVRRRVSLELSPPSPVWEGEVLRSRPCMMMTTATVVTAVHTNP
jgi:hypothetical protein